MANISSQLADIAILRSLLLQKVSNGLSSQVSGAYQNIIDSIAQDIRGANKITLRNMSKTIAELKERFEVDISFLKPELEDLAVTESAFALNSVNATANFDIFSKVPPESTIRNIVAVSLMSDGRRARKIDEWFSGIDAKMLSDIEAVVQNGVIGGQTNHQISQTLANIMGTSRHHAETIAITATSHVSSEARMAVYEANDDVLKGYTRLETFDDKICEICLNADGNFYKINEKKPPAQLHFRCRGMYKPELKSWRDMGIDMDEISEGTRSSLDGYVSGKVDAIEWIEGKGAKFQKDYLGKGRYDLYKSGKIKFNDLVTNRGRILTVKELREKYS